MCMHNKNTRKDKNSAVVVGCHLKITTKPSTWIKRAISDFRWLVIFYWLVGFFKLFCFNLLNNGHNKLAIYTVMGLVRIQNSGILNLKTNLLLFKPIVRASLWFFFYPFWSDSIFWYSIDHVLFVYSFNTYKDS